MVVVFIFISVVVIIRFIEIVVLIRLNSNSVCICFSMMGIFMCSGSVVNGILLSVIRMSKGVMFV